jgi:hypothetical protein
VPTRTDVTPNGGGEHDERAALERTLETAAHVPVPSALHGTRREPPAPSGLARITRSISSDSMPRSTISRFSSISFRWQKYLRASLTIVANTPATDPIRTIHTTILKGTGSDAMDSKKLFMTLVPDQEMALSGQDCTTIPRSSGCEADLAGNIRRYEEILAKKGPHEKGDGGLF